MLPFVFLDESKLGPFHPYGLAVMLGFFAWDAVIMKQAVRRGYDRADFRVLTLGLLFLGWFFAWWIDAVFYHPADRSVVSTLFAFQGFSSTGAIVGATVAAVLWCRYRVVVFNVGPRLDGDRKRFSIAKRETPIPLLGVSEVIVATWPVAFMFGRLGCSLIHDHPGITVPKGTLGSLLAVAWPTGPDDGIDHVFGPLHLVTGGSEARFDLGLVEFFILAAIAGAFALTWKKDLAMGTYTIVGSLVYGPLRFGLDFLRAKDGPGGELRFAGLTFAQYWSLTIIVLGLVLLIKRRMGAIVPHAPTLKRSTSPHTLADDE